MKEEKFNKIKVKSIVISNYKDEGNKTIESIVLKLIEMEINNNRK